MSDKTQPMSSMTGAEVRDARKRLGLTQTQLAELMGMTGASYISRIEKDVQAIGSSSQRLVQAYLEGYRPKDWPLKK